MKVLVIGGTKFLGYHLIQSLLRNGFEVTMFNRGVSPNPFSAEVEHIRGDRDDFDAFYSSLHRRKFDAVIDLIGYRPEQIDSVVKTFEGRIGRYIFISSGQVYLVTENRRHPAREEDYFQPIIACPPGEEAGYEYGMGKRGCEDRLQRAYGEKQFPEVRLRCPIIHGPGDYTLRLYSYILRIKDGQPLIIPEGRDNLIRHIYVKDVVRAIMTALKTPGIEGRAYNLASLEVMPLHEFLQIVADVMGKTLQWREVSFPKLTEFSLDDSISPFSGFWVSYLDPGRAKRELGFKSTPLKEWLGETVQWFLREYRGEMPENFRLRSREIDLLNSGNTDGSI